MNTEKQSTLYVHHRNGEKYHLTVMHTAGCTSLTKIVWYETPSGHRKCDHVPVKDFDIIVPESDIERVLAEALTE